MNFLKKSQSFHKILKQCDLCSAILPHLKMVFAIASSQVMLIFLCHNSQVKMSWQSFWQFVMEIEASENIKCKIHYSELCKICWFTWSWGFKIWNNKMNTDFTTFHTFSCWWLLFVAYWLRGRRHVTTSALLYKKFKEVYKNSRKNAK